jgi:hypothetical protein
MSNTDFLKQRHSLLFKDLPAADGSNYGVRVIGYDEETDDYIITEINWDTKELIEQDNEPRYIDAFKITYRYSPESAISIGEQA